MQTINNLRRFAKPNSKQFIEHLQFRNRQKRNGKIFGGAFFADALTASYKSGSNIATLDSTNFASLFSFTRSTKAWDYNSSGLLTEAAVGVVRRGYDPSTLLASGWMLEGASTNLCFWSEAFDNATWSKTGVTINPNTSVSPSGEMIMDKLVYDVSSGSHQVQSNASTSVLGQPYTISVFAKAAELSSVLLISTGGGLADSGVTFNLSTGVASAPFGSASLLAAGSMYVGGGVWRLWFTVTPTASAAFAGRIRLPSATGDGISGVYVWGMQIEQNYFASSYIPTTTTATVRAADELSIANFANIFGSGAPQGFVICEVMAGQAAGGSSQHFATLSDGTLNNRISMITPAGATTTQLFQTSSGASVNTSSAGSYTPGTPCRLGVRWNGGAAALCLNGGTLVGTSGLQPLNLDRLQIGNSPSNASALNGRIRGIWASSKVISDAQMIAACTFGADVASIVG